VAAGVSVQSEAPSTIFFFPPVIVQGRAKRAVIDMPDKDAVPPT
jgi:hypothetical protein